MRQRVRPLPPGIELDVHNASDVGREFKRSCDDRGNPSSAKQPSEEPELEDDILPGAGDGIAWLSRRLPYVVWSHHDDGECHLGVRFGLLDERPSLVGLLLQDDRSQVQPREQPCHCLAGTFVVSSQPYVRRNAQTLQRYLTQAFRAELRHPLP